MKCPHCGLDADALPKTEDGVPVVPGMKVYLPLGSPMGYTVVGVHRDMFVLEGGQGRPWPSHAYGYKWYSTPEAAKENDDASTD